MDIDLKEYNILKDTVGRLMLYEMIEHICTKRDKESLGELVDLLNNHNYDYLKEILPINTSEENLIKNVKRSIARISKSSIYNMEENEIVNIIGYLVRFNNFLQIKLTGEERVSLLVKRYEKQRNKIDNLLKEVVESHDNFLREVKENKDVISNKFKELIKDEEQIEEKYRELFKRQEKFQTSIIKQMQDVQDGVHRKELAVYFLKERKSLKGILDIRAFIIFMFAVLFFAGCISFTDNIIDFLKKLIFYSEFSVCVTIIVLLILVYLGVVTIKNLYISRDLEKINASKLSWLFTPYWGWLCATFIGMGLIFGIAVNLFMSDIKFSYIEFLKRLPLFMILIWFTWFCAKQFSYIKQICDEYEYKYLLSMSYLSYRNEAKELSDKIGNEAILVSLLDSVIKNIATSPIQLVKSDCHTPFSEVFNSIKGNIDVK